MQGARQCRGDCTGYSLNPPTSPSLFEIADIAQDVHSVIGDIRDYATLKAAFDAAQPEIVLHLAAQPIVRDSYKILLTPMKRTSWAR